MTLPISLSGRTERAKSKAKVSRWKTLSKIDGEGEGLAPRRHRAGLQLDQFWLGDPAGPEDSDFG
ncbi:MAG: hypothetical protein JWQ49_868 [Edaphobacter sp.]|nr:hypothetical protein [Edaphobacter sp.]